MSRNTPATDKLVDEVIAGLSETARKVARSLWDNPELSYGETMSAELIALTLSDLGFAVETGIAGIPTAFSATAGAGGPVIAILGEYDALPNLSQQADILVPKPIAGQGGVGHGCGHNLLGVGSLLAAAAIKRYLEASGAQGIVRFFGCPAEEGGAGKVFMARAGVFDGVDIALTWHPAFYTGVKLSQALANTRIHFSFEGRSAHAAAAPDKGRSALDACELMNVGCNYLREHMPDSARIHYAYLDAGGTSPAVVQSHATTRYLIRAENNEELGILADRVRKVAEGAALMTETTMTSKVMGAISNLVQNSVLENVMDGVLQRVGAPDFTGEDEAKAQGYLGTLDAAELRTSRKKLGGKQGMKALCDWITPLGEEPMSMGSTDVGDVSWLIPTAQLACATSAIGTQLHTWQMTGQGRSDYAMRGMEHAARVMALTAIEIAANPHIIASAKEELRDRVGPDGYRSLLPADLDPPIAQLSKGH